MSSEKSFKVHPVLSGALNIEDSMDVGVYRGFAEQTAVRLAADNLANNNSQKWTYTVPSLESITDLELYWHVEQQINAVVPAGTDGNVDWGNAVALAPYAALQQVRSITLSLNGASLTLEVSASLNELLKFYESKHDTDYHSMCPNMLDDFVCDYADGVAFRDINVLSSFHAGHKRARGAFPCDFGVLAAGAVPTGIATVAGVAATDVNVGVHYDMVVPLLISPTKWREFVRSQYSVVGLNKLEITLQMSSPERILSVGQLAGGTAPAGSYILGKITYPSQTFKQSELLFTSYKCFPDTQPKPLQVLPYMDIQTRSISAGTAFTDSTTVKTIQTGIITMTTIPEYIVITVSKPKASLKCFDSNSYYSIVSANGQYCEKQILGTLDDHQLWLASRKAGSHQTYEQWAGKMALRTAAGVASVVGTTGSMLILKPGESFPLPPNVAAGSVYTSQFSISLNVRANYSNAQWAQKGASEIPEITVIYMNPAFVSTADGNSVNVVGLLGSSDIANAIRQIQSGDKVYSSERVGGAAPEKMNDFSGVLKYGAPLLKKYAKSKLAAAGDAAGVVGMGKSYGGPSFGAKPRHPML